MVPGLNPVMALINDPVPVPSVVVPAPPMVGLADVDQQTPLAVTDAPPSKVILPPLNAPVEVIEDTAVVVAVGVVKVVNVRSLP